MRIAIDTCEKTLVLDENELPLYSDEAFKVLSDLWVKVGWNQKYVYTLTWFGQPIIQLPDDMIRFQEVVMDVKPTLIIETGVAHGGSLIYSASLLKLLGGGRVIGVDVEIRPHNREKICSHPLAEMVTLIEGSSTEKDTILSVEERIRIDDRVLVVLDSNHSYAHVTDELDAYSKFVSLGSYIIATDGVMRDLVDVPRGQRDWKTDNPATAAEDFICKNPQFELMEPRWKFNESTLEGNVTHWPSAWLRRIS